MSMEKFSCGSTSKGMNVVRDPHSRVKLWGINGPREPSLRVCVHAITSHITIDQGFGKIWRNVVWYLERIATLSMVGFCI